MAVTSDSDFRQQKYLLEEYSLEISSSYSLYGKTFPLESNLIYLS